VELTVWWGGRKTKSCCVLGRKKSKNLIWERGVS